MATRSTLAPGELVGMEFSARTRQRHEIEEAVDGRGRLGPAVDSSRPFDDCLADTHPRVERGKRILEHDLDEPWQRPSPRPVGSPDVDALDDDPPRRRRRQAEDHSCERGLPAAAFTHDAKHLASANFERDVIDGEVADCGTARPEGLGYANDRHERCILGHDDRHSGPPSGWKHLTIATP